MTSTATDAEQLREIDEDIRRAWSTYREHLRELSGPAYEDAENECWDELQDELRVLERRRRLLTGQWP